MPNKARRQELLAARRQRERQRRIYIGLGVGAAALLIIGAIALYVLNSQKPTQTAAAGQLVTAGTCGPIQSVPDEGNAHITPGETPTYKSQPPSSGPHNPIPLPAGIYDQPVDTTMEVHSLEHGYIVIHYKDLSPNGVDLLKNLVQRDPRKMILSPYSGMDYTLTLTAWDHLQTCTGVDQQAIETFISTFRDKGPENVP